MRARNGQWLEWLPIAGIVVVFILATIGVSLYAPAYEAPDEVAHFGYVRHLVSKRTIPQFGEGSTASHEAGQAPLYYLVGAMASLAAGDWTARPSVLPVYDEHNPNVSFDFQYREPPALENRNFFAHDYADRLQLYADELALHLARLVGAGFGALAILMTFLTARELYPNRPAIAYMAALLLALNPQFIFICAVVNNDSAVAGTASLALFVLARIIGRGLSYRRALMLGGSLGLALLAKLNLLALGPVAVLGLLIALRRTGQESPSLLRAGVTQVGLAGLVTALVAGWWYLLNWLRYGDPIAWQPMMAAQGLMTRSEPISVLEAAANLLRARDSYWALFGWTNVLAPSALYVFTDALVAASLLAAGLNWGRRVARRPAPERSHDPSSDKRTESRQATLFLLLLWTLIAIASLVRWIQLNAAAAQGRLLFPAASAIAILLAAGLASPLPRRADRALAGTIGLGMATFSAVALLESFVPAYQTPNWILVSAEPGIVLRTQPIWLPISWGSDLRLDRAELRYKPSGGSNSGAHLEGSLQWQNLSAAAMRVQSTLRLLDVQKAVRAEATASVSFDGAAHSVQQPISMRLPEALPPGRYRLELSVKDGAGTPLLARWPQINDPGPQPVVVWFEDVFLPCNCLPAGTAINPVAFGEALHLVGYSKKMAGDVAEVVSYWQAERPLAKSYVFYLHVFDSRGDKVGQYDAVPYAGALPTNSWSAGQIVPFAARFVLPPSGGPFRVKAGVYEYPSLAHLPTPDGKPEVSLGPVPTATAPPSGPITVFQGGIKLLGHNLEVRGRQAVLTLYWQASGTIGDSYSVFVHAIDADGRMVAQGDGPPEEGERATTEWPAGEVIEDVHQFSTPPGKPLQVQIGLYRPTDGWRLGVIGGGDTVDLGKMPAAR